MLQRYLRETQWFPGDIKDNIEATAAGPNKEQSLQELGKLLQEIPITNFLVVEHVFELLGLVVKNEATNRMSQSNLNLLFSAVFQFGQKPSGLEAIALLVQYFSSQTK